ncbi:MAG: ZIP family metal transporter [Solirubrobacterales bacterium]|nr:ZIP family metal transporter [Solirubrobacterales bacterium]MCB8915873.1 ZIP family metal transporter [Thermoleophilales bacterium]
MIELIILASVTALATGIGAIPVMLLGNRARSMVPLLLGIAGGVMGVASVMGLIMPALDRGTVAEVAGGVLIGIAFLMVARRYLNHLPRDFSRAGGSTGLLVFLVLLVHSLPEGFAVGTAYEADPAQLGIFVVIAISIQNIPEGTSVAIPLAAAGASGNRQFWMAVASSVPQPIGAVIAYLLVQEISALLPVSFGFAAGAMLALTLIEILPDAWVESPRQTFVGLAVSIPLMVALSLALGV